MPQSPNSRFDFGLPTYDQPESAGAIGIGAPAAQERAPISVVDRITDVESGGDPTAKNPDSTATGLGQFIESTWMDMVGKYRPDVLEGRTRQQVLKLRENGPLSKEMTDHYKTENTEHLRKLGIPSTPDTTYLAHFLGPDGAANVLRAPAGTPVSRLLTSRAISSNTSVLKGKTNSQVIAWAKRKMSGGGAKAPADPMEARFQELEAAEPGRYQLIYEDEYDAWHAEWQTKRDEEPGGFSRGFVTTMLEQNPNLTGEALEGFSYLAPEGMQKMLLDASVDLKSLGKDATPEEYKLRSGSLWDVESLDDFGTWIAEASGQGVASSVPSMITGTGGMLVGKRIAGKAGGIGGALAGAAVPSFGFNYGEVYAALKHEKIAPDAAAAVALYAAVPMAMLDSLPVGAVLTRMGGMKEIKRQVARNIARRIAAEGAKGMGREGITEAAQEAIKEAAVAIKADKPFFTLETVGRVAESGVAGMAAGGPMAAPAGIRRDQVAAAEAPGIGEAPQDAPAATVPPKPAGPLTRAVSKAPEGAGASVGPGQLAQLERDDGSYTPVQVQNIEDGWANIKDEAGEEHQVPIEMLSPLASTPEVAEPAPQAPIAEAPVEAAPVSMAPVDDVEPAAGSEAGTREATPSAVAPAASAPISDIIPAPTDAELEIPDFLKRTPEKAKKTKKTIYRGSGRADRGSVYNEHAPAVPILGEGRYFAFNEEAAKRYGPDIETSELSLENPLTVTSGEQWRSLTKEAGWKVPNPFGQGVAETKKRTEAMRALVLSKGHDGVIVQWDDSLLTDVGADGENIKLLRNVFGDPQIVDYREPEKQGEARADEPLRTVEQDLEAARPKFDDYISGKATLRRLRFAVGVDQGVADRLLDAAVEDGRLLKSKKGVYRRKPANYDENIAKLKASAASRRKDKVPTGPKKPVVAMLKKAGGVDPTSTLAGELRAMGINSRTAPGLFRKGGIGAVDNFVAREHPLFENDGDDRGYIKPEVLMDALAGEQADNPRVLQEQKDAEAEVDNAAQEADAREATEAAMEEFGLKGKADISERAFSLYAQGDISADDAVERAVIQLGEDSTSETDDRTTETEEIIPFGDTEPGPARAPVEGLPEGRDEGDGAGGAEEAVPASDADARAREDKDQAPRQGEFLGTEEISDAELAQRKSDEGLKAKVDQLPADQGLFSDDSKQTNLVKAAEESAKATSTYGAYGASNKLVTQERAEVLRARLKAKLKGELRSGIDPEILAIGTELTVFHIEAGSRRFMDVAKALAADLDTEIGKLRPFLRGWYNGARDMVEDSGADVAGMDDADAVRAALPELGEEPAARGKADRLAGTLQALGAGADGVEVEAADVFPRLMSGGRAKLSNGWTLKRSLVAGEQRIELIGPATFSEGEEIKADGVFSERINYNTRYFIPTNKADGERTIAVLTKHRPVVELGDGGQAQTGIDLDDFEEVGSSIAAPTFYSAVLRAVEASTLKRGTPAQWLGTLQNTPGIKQEELDWIGVAEWLKAHDGPVTKEDLLDFIRANQIEVQELEKGAVLARFADEFGLKAKDRNTKFESYQLPGGENYKELLLTLPSKADYQEKEPPGTFTGGHFSEPNVLAHIRFNERTDADGRRTLLIEEIQSDWHQKGRKRGYQTPERKLPNGWRLEKRNEKTDGSGRDGFFVIDRDNGLVAWGATEREAIDASGEWIDADNASAVPDAPFKTSWPALALKRMVRDAAETGFDSVSWTPGEVQAERHDLSKQVDHIGYNVNSDGTFDVSAFAPGGVGRETTGNMILSEPKMSIETVEATFGKYIADEMMKARAGRRRRVLQGDPSSSMEMVLSGDDLKVGGEGMKAFYDKILVSAANKIGKKFGAKVGTTEIELPADVVGGFELRQAKQQEVWTLPITDELRAAVMEGQPVFSSAPRPKLDAKQRKGLEAAMRATVRKIAGKDIPVELYPFLSGEGSAVYQSDMSRFENAGGRRAGTQGGSASVWSNGRALVKLATADPAFDPMDSAAHEAYHVTAALMQTDAERAVINKDMKRIRAFAAEELGLAADSDAIASLPSYEAEAIAYQRYDRMRDAGLPLSKIKGIPRPVMLFFERVRRLVAEIKKVLTGKGFDRFEDVFEDTHQGRMAEREKAGRLRTFKEMGSSATNPESDLAVQFLQTLAEEDELFAYPKSTSGELKQVFTDIDPSVRFLGGNTSPEEARESGADQKFLLRSANDEDIQVFQTEDKVWIDVSALLEGGGGAGVYAAVGDYARNTGRVFVGDPAGITDVAMRRRTENMLSQALRHGTTAHLEPHPDQLEGNPKIGIPPLRWQSGDDVGNIRSLIQTSIGSLEHYVPEIKDARYDFDSGTFRTGEGEPISDGRFKDWHTSGGGRKAGAGRRTLKRGILLNTVLRAPRGDLAGLLERSLRFQDKLVAGTELQQTFYSSVSNADVGTARAADRILGRVPADAEIEGMAEDGGLEVGDVRIAPLGGELVKLNVQGAFESASDKLRRTKNPLLIDLASRVDRYFDEREARVGWINGRVRPILKRLGIGSVTTKDMVKKVTEPFEEYWRHHDNGRSAEAEAVLAEAQPAVRELVEEVKAIYSDIGDLNQKSGVKVFDAALKSWRPIGKVRAGKFWPRLLRPDVQRVLQNPSNDPELWSDMVDALINDGHIETRDEALKYVKNYFTEETRSDYFAGIEKARSRALPEIFYDYSWQAFQRYTWRWTARISQIDQFGQITTAQTKDSFGKVMESTLDSRTQKYVREAENRVYEKRSGDLYETIMGHLNLLATGIMLGNWATATLNLIGGTTLNAQMFGATRMTKAYAKLATDWKNVQQTGVEYGILGKDVLNILRDTEQTSGTYFDVNSRLHDGLAVFAKQTMTWGGYRGTENIIRATAMIAGWTQLQDSLTAWNQNLTSAKSFKYRAFMQRNRIDSDKLLAENGAGPETSRYMRLMVNIPQGSYRIDQVPIYVDTPLGRFFFKYQKFGTQVSRMFWQNFLKPFIATVQGGEAVTVAGAEKRVKTFLPMFRYLVYGFVGGSAILAARSAMFNYNDPGPDWEDLLEALKDDDRARMWGMIFDRAYSSWMAASFAGFFGNYIQMGRDFHDKQRVKNPLDPPGLASIDAVKELFLRWREQGTITARDLDQIGERTLSFYRASKRTGLTALSVAGSELREARLLDAYRDRNYVRKATRMYADEMGIANRRTSSGRFGKNEMSPTNQRIYEALMLGDAESARAIVRDTLRGETASERKKLKASMQSSARARQPIRIAGGGTKAERAAFLRWSRKKLAKSNSQRVQDTHRRYLRAAVRAGLMNP